MNNRIQELAEQAGLLGPSSRGGNAHEAAEKFAALIIAECAKACVPTEQEPVAWIFQHDETGHTMCVDERQIKWGFEKANSRWKKISPLYDTPQKRPWVGLTDVEWSDLYEAHHDKYNLPKQGSPDGMDYERAIEAKLKELNHD